MRRMIDDLTLSFRAIVLVKYPAKVTVAGRLGSSSPSTVFDFTFFRLFSRAAHENEIQDRCA